jgi:hypothetical protein
MEAATFDIITGVEYDAGLITEFKLEQNYPNPFNPGTAIKWQTAAGCLNTIKIYDILGNEVATLINQYLPAGSHEVVFDASRMPSGIYYYKLKSGNYSDTKKMVLLR